MLDVYFDRAKGALSKNPTKPIKKLTLDDI